MCDALCHSVQLLNDKYSPLVPSGTLCFGLYDTTT